MAENGKPPLSQQDWEKIKDLFAEALGVPIEQRTAWLAAAWPERSDGQAMVAELLYADVEASSSFLDPTGRAVGGSWRSTGRPPGQPIPRGARHRPWVARAKSTRVNDERSTSASRSGAGGRSWSAPGCQRAPAAEALVTRDIAHEGLCRTFDLIDHPIGPGTALPEGTLVPCLTMQLLDGESLEEYLKTHRPLAPAEALPLLRQIAATLDELHRRGVIHRDLKPSNVMLVGRNGQRRAVLTDFGLAKPLDESLSRPSPPSGRGAYSWRQAVQGDRPSRARTLRVGLVSTGWEGPSAPSRTARCPELMPHKLKRGQTPPSCGRRACDIGRRSGAASRAIRRAVPPRRRYLDALESGPRSGVAAAG